MAERDGVMRAMAEALADLDSEGLGRLVRGALETGIDAGRILREGFGEGMRLVGERYECGEYFLAELVMAGVTMNEAMELVRPFLGGEGVGYVGKVVIGTVEGDLHDIGKNIVVSMLRSAGFEVVDIGVDVSPAGFVESVRLEEPDIVCMSTLLSVTLPNVEAVVHALEAAGLRGRVKVLVGGRCLNPEMARGFGADAFGVDAWDAVVKTKALLSV